MTAAPLLMVAPNGARRTRQDHPALPVTIAQIAHTAALCAAAGADAIHTHVRDAQGGHVLDAGLYREAQSAIAAAAPDLAVQITTESAGRYDAAAQRALLYDLRPAWASASLRELLSDDDTAEASRLYHWAAEAGVQLQHIVYSPDEVRRLADCMRRGVIPPPADDSQPALQLLFVLGRYADNLAGAPEMLDDFLPAYAEIPVPEHHRSFMVCAFGERETDCLLAAAKAGGDCRVGFENNLHRRDGELAEDNAARVREVRELLDALSGN